MKTAEMPITEKCTTPTRSTGKLITIEGIDGSGKSTLSAALKEKLVAHNHQVLLTREPGGSELGKHLRNLLHERTIALCPKTEFLLFAADRAQHIASVVKPALDLGMTVLSDRMEDSSLAYQGYGRGLDCSMIREVNRWAMDGIQPDLIIYLSLDIEIALERIQKTRHSLTAFEKEQQDFWRRVASGFETIFQGRSHVLKLDATLPTNQLVDAVMKKLEK